MKNAIRQIHHVPGYAKEDLARLVNDEDYELREDVISAIKKYQKQIEAEWPPILRNFVFAKLGMKASKEYSQDEDFLIQQLNETAKRIKLPSDIIYEIKRLIDGERTAFNFSFKKWLKELLSGSIPKQWPDELIKFLIKAEKEI